MSDERQIPRGNPHNYEAGFTIEDHRDELISRLGKALERITDLTAEVERLKHTVTVLGEKASQAVGFQEQLTTLKGLLREWSHLGAALITGARMPRTIEELADRTDQQLQPTQDMRPNPNRQGTPHEHAHERTLACSAPPKCQRWLCKVRHADRSRSVGR